MTSCCCPMTASPALRNPHKSCFCGSLCLCITNETDGFGYEHLPYAHTSPSSSLGFTNRPHNPNNNHHHNQKPQGCIYMYIYIQITPLLSKGERLFRGFVARAKMCGWFGCVLTSCLPPIRERECLGNLLGTKQEWRAQCETPLNRWLCGILCRIGATIRFSCIVWGKQ